MGCQRRSKGKKAKEQYGDLLKTKQEIIDLQVKLVTYCMYYTTGDCLSHAFSPTGNTVGTPFGLGRRRTHFIDNCFCVDYWTNPQYQQKDGKRYIHASRQECEAATLSAT